MTDTAKILKRWLVRIGYHSHPSFLIIGAQKGGTKSLRRYLLEHPQIAPNSNVSEIHFFEKEQSYARGYAHYHRYFPYPHELSGAKITFDSTPNYLSVPSAPSRIHQYDPTLKLVAVLRDPVDRAFSAWNMVRGKGREDASFETRIEHDIEQIEALTDMDSMDAALAMSPVAHGMYHVHVTRYLRFFPREQVLILDSQCLRDSPNESLAKVTTFLGIAPHHWDQIIETHVGAYAEKISPQASTRLATFYKPYNQRLYELLEREFDWK